MAKKSLDILKRLARAFLLCFFPVVYHERVARHVRRMFAEQSFPMQDSIKKRLFGAFGEVTVLSGPFQGMKYINEVFCSSATPRWLGIYEQELHAIIEKICVRQYKAIINVGCAEGYYAVGLARRCPHSIIHAFDVDPISRSQCKTLSQLNHVDQRVHVGGLLKGASLSKLAQFPTCILCDIEGYEFTLLNPVLFPVLKKCDILVEIHELTKFGPFVEETLRNRFCKTHFVETIRGCSRLISENRQFFLLGTPENDIQWAIDEHRLETQKWLWMEKQGVS